jgi:hypothetical protein
MQILIACLVVLLASCAAQPFSGQIESDIVRDMDICTPPSSMGNPMRIGTLPPSRRESEYTKCMKEKGYAKIPAMPKDFGSN